VGDSAQIDVVAWSAAQTRGASSALFKHFRNKEAMWRAVMEALALEVGSRFQAALQESGSHAHRMFAIITAYLTVVEGIPAIPALMFADPRQMHGAGKYLRQEITSRFGWFHSTLCEQIEAGVQAGEFRGDVDPKVAAGLAAGIAQSLILRWRVSGGAIDMLAEAGKVYPMFLAASRACRLREDISVIASRVDHGSNETGSRPEDVGRLAIPPSNRAAADHILS
jgi:AcrR family transcriptional regulator